MVKRTIFSENTLIPVSLVLTLLGAAYLFARVMFATDANAENIADLQSSMKTMQTEIIVNLRDNSANLYELKTQITMLDTKLQSVSERLNRMDERQKKRP